MNSLGPTIQAIRHPGRRNRLVRPSMRRTSDYSSATAFRLSRYQLRTILVNIDNVLSTTQRRSIAVSGVVITTIKLIQDQGGTITANILNLGKIWVFNNVTSGITRVGCQKHRGTSSNLFCNLIRVDLIVVTFGKGYGDRRELVRPVSDCSFSRQRTKWQAYVLEQRQHLRIGGIIRNRERQVRISQDGRNSDQPSTTTGHNAHILPRILALLTLSVLLIVKPSYSSTERLDTSSGAVFSRSRVDGNGRRTRKTASNIVICLGSTLT